MSLRNRIMLGFSILVSVTVILTSAALTISARNSIYAQKEQDGRLLVEQFARAVYIGEEIRIELEGIYIKQQQSQKDLAPMLQILSLATGKTEDEITKLFIESTGLVEINDFASRRMGEGVWLGQFTEHLLSQNVSGMWVFDQELKTRLAKVDAEYGLKQELSAEEMEKVHQALRTGEMVNYRAPGNLIIIGPVPDEAGNTVGVTAVAFPTTQIDQALRQQLQLAIGVAVLVLAAALLQSYLLARQVTRPINRLTEAAAELEAGHYTPGRLVDFVERKDEMGQAARVFEQMGREVSNRDRNLRLLREVIPVGVALSVERNFDRLLDTILTESQNLCNADAGTLYLVDEERKRLEFVVLRNKTMDINYGGTTGKKPPFAPLNLYNPQTSEPNHNNVATHSLLANERVNIADAYTAEGFDFSGTRTFDAQTGYRSKSFLTIPLQSGEKEPIGVLQLINARDPVSGAIIPFTPDVVLESLIALAYAALSAYIRELKLKQEIEQLRIEIDTVKKDQQVKEITESDYFQSLQQRVKNLKHKSST